MKNPFFTVVIPCLNEEGFLPLLMRDLVRQSYKDFEVIVVDAKSEDSTEEKCKTFSKKLPKYKFLSSRKRNVAYQRNLGASHARGEYLVFMDADVNITRNFLDELRKVVESQKNDIITIKLSENYYTNKEKVASRLTNLLISITNMLGKPLILEALMVVKSKSFKLLKGFDHNFHNDEGDDLVKRAKEVGMRYLLCKKPTYKVSFRRAQKEGFFRLGIKVLGIELMNLFRINLPWDKVDKIYPMQGGKDYSSKNTL